MRELEISNIIETMIFYDDLYVKNSNVRNYLSIILRTPQGLLGSSA